MLQGQDISVPCPEAGGGGCEGARGTADWTESVCAPDLDAESFDAQIDEE